MRSDHENLGTCGELNCVLSSSFSNYEILLQNPWHELVVSSVLSSLASGLVLAKGMLEALACSLAVAMRKLSPWVSIACQPGFWSKTHGAAQSQVHQPTVKSRVTPGLQQENLFRPQTMEVLWCFLTQHRCVNSRYRRQSRYLKAKSFQI